MTHQRKNRRRIHIVDSRLQFSLALSLTGVMAGVAALYAIALYVVPATGALESMNAEETRRFFLGTNLVYFALATMILFTVALLLTHRIAGPALVIERAIRGTMKGEYEHRLKLRKRDHLQPLASAITDWRDHLASGYEAQQGLLNDLGNCLEEGDSDGAKEVLSQLRKSVPQQHDPEQEPAAADAVETENAETEAVAS